MASSRNLVHVLVLLIATGLLTAVPANSAQHNLIEASAAGNLARVKAFLAANDIVNARDAKGGTALIRASENGHLDVVQALLASKADVNAKNNVGYTALMIASQNV
jgi:ankyrin repeat protein